MSPALLRLIALASTGTEVGDRHCLTSGAGCGPHGYCDPSVGACICAPGYHGNGCEHAHFGACRLHSRGEIACNTFAGLMSCTCRQQCEARYGSIARWRVPVCWAHASGAQANTSDLPADASSVRFHTHQWPPRGKCAGPEPPRRCPTNLHLGVRRAHNVLGGEPLPNRQCEGHCSHRGTCIRPFTDRDYKAKERFPLEGRSAGRGAAAAQRGGGKRGGNHGGGATLADGTACICHTGYSGRACEHADASACFNGCAGHGECVGRFCLCDRGHHGVDCSLRIGVPPGAATPPSRAAPPARAVAPMWAYPLPTEMSLEHVYQRDPDRRGQYYANLMFMEQLLSRADAVADPEDAALFFVPVMVMQMAGNLWHPYEFLASVVRHVRTAYPYWNRTNGTDHVFFLTTDRAGCWKPWELEHSIIITYLGFPAPEAYFGFEERLQWPVRGPNRRNNAYDVSRGSVATELACYDPKKDVVVPVDASIGADEEAKLPRPGAPYTCNTRRRTLMFMGGSMQNMGRVEYSQGVRQAINKLHANESDFVLGGKFTLDELRDSLFCLSPSGCASEVCSSSRDHHAALAQRLIAPARALQVGVGLAPLARDAHAVRAGDHPAQRDAALRADVAVRILLAPSHQS